MKHTLLSLILVFIFMINVYGVDDSVKDYFGICNPSETFDYVIVTNQTIINSRISPNIENLLQARREKGLSVTSVAISQIISVYEGKDGAEKLRNFIKDAYINWKTKYILLGGDQSIIPIKYLNVGKESILSDMYYQSLNGTFDDNKNGLYGEKDDGKKGGYPNIESEVYVGRVPVKNENEFSNFVFKTLIYEQSDEQMYLANSLLIGEYLGKDIWGGDLLDSIWENTLSLDRKMQYTSLYERDKHWDGMHLIRLLNTGYYSIVNYVGHSHYWTAMKVDWRKNRELQITNHLPFFLYSQGSYAGNFHFNSVARRLMTDSRYGAFAVLMNSSAMRVENREYHKIFWESVIKSENRMLGFIHNQSQEKMGKGDFNPANRWVIYQMNLLGDPALSLKIPKNLSKDISDNSNDNIMENSGPLADDIIFVTYVNKSKKILLFASDKENDELVYYIEKKPTHGELLGEFPNIEYRPKENYIGEDSFIYSVKDGPFNGDEGNVKILVKEESNDWQEMNIGEIQQLGKFEEIDNKLSLIGGGVGFAGRSDSFYYVYRSVSGNTIFEAQIDQKRIQKNGTLIGIMIREDLENDAKFMGIYIEKNKDLFKVRSSWRPLKGDYSFANESSLEEKVWLRLRRKENRFISEISNNKQEWFVVGEEIINMKKDIYLGSFIASGNKSKTVNSWIDLEKNGL